MLTIDLRRSTLPVCLVLLASCGSDAPVHAIGACAGRAFPEDRRLRVNPHHHFDRRSERQLQVIGNY